MFWWRATAFVPLPPAPQRSATASRFAEMPAAPLASGLKMHLGIEHLGRGMPDSGKVLRPRNNNARSSQAPASESDFGRGQCRGSVLATTNEPDW